MILDALVFVIICLENKKGGYWFWDMSAEVYRNLQLLVEVEGLEGVVVKSGVQLTQSGWQEEELRIISVTR